MIQILVYGDSLSWGIIPHTRERLPFEQRWPGVLETRLMNVGKPVRVIENCLNGRRTVWDDPFKPGRNGAVGLGQVVEMHSPLAVVVILLGTNDFQDTHDHNAWLSAQGSARLIEEIHTAPLEPGQAIPEILLVAPPAIHAPRGPIASKFRGAAERSYGHSEELKAVALHAQIRFFDSNTVTGASKVDGIHLDRDQHETLGRAIAQQVLSLLE